MMHFSRDLLYSPRLCEAGSTGLVFDGRFGRFADGKRGTVKNIFVGNLSFNTSEDELRQAFEAFGQVDRVSILTDRETGRSRGFAFVEMANTEEGDKAIAGLNGSQIGGRTINVNEAKPKGERAGAGGGRDRGRR
jgi:cold-inducible RNA-binding protein